MCTFIFLLKRCFNVHVTLEVSHLVKSNLVSVDINFTHLLIRRAPATVCVLACCALYYP